MSHPCRVVLCETLSIAFLLGGMVPAGAQSLNPVSREMLCVTLGNLKNIPNRRLEIADPEMRAVLLRRTPQVAEAKFQYLGPTKEQAELGSGEIREQFGFKFRAADPCNLVYVMWRFKKAPLLAVQVKSNPGMHTSAECKNNGYTTIATRDIAPPSPGSSHTLHASLNGSKLEVNVDGGPAWNVNLPATALTFNGPVGIRSDNAHLKFKFLAARPTGAPLACSTDGD